MFRPQAFLVAFAVVAGLSSPSIADDGRRIARLVLEGGVGITNALSERRLLATTSAIGVDFLVGSRFAFGVRVGVLSWRGQLLSANAALAPSVELDVRYAFAVGDVVPEVGARIGGTVLGVCFDNTMPCTIDPGLSVAAQLGVAKHVSLFDGSRLWLGVIVRGSPWLRVKTAQPTTSALVSLEL